VDNIDHKIHKESDAKALVNVVRNSHCGCIIIILDVGKAILNPFWWPVEIPKLDGLCVREYTWQVN
jgi:hypothetical protein